MNKIRLFFILLLVTFCFYLVGCENVNRPIEEPDIQEDIHKVEEPDTQEDIHKESEGLVFSLAYDGLGYIVDGIGTCTDRNLIIPNEYDGLPVIEISKGAFENCYQLISVTFPEEMLSIDQFAFAFCSNLERVEFNEKLNRIDDHAFENCALKSIRIPDSVTFIGGNAFCVCRDISHVYIGSGLCSWSNFSPFSSCHKIVEVINKSQMEIKAEDNVWEMTVTPNVKQIITDEAKSNIIVTNDGLVLYNDNDKVYLVNYIGNETTIIIPNNVTDIYKYAFYGYSHIAKVIIGEGVKTIGECAFENSSIASVTIPNSIEEIHNSAF